MGFGDRAYCPSPIGPDHDMGQAPFTVKADREGPRVMDDAPGRYVRQPCCGHHAARRGGVDRPHAAIAAVARASLAGHLT